MRGNVFIKSLFLIAFAILIGVTAELFTYSQSQSVTQPDETYRNEFSDKYGIYSLPIPSDLKFAGESVPVEFFDVKESIDRELLINTYWQSQTVLLLKKSTRYFKVIDSILAKNGVPSDFKYLAVAESGLANVGSPAGAQGVWQFMKAAANQYGLLVNSEVDERYDLEKSTEAACKYLNDSYRKFGNWALVAASYNMGVSGVQGQLNVQDVDSYYDLYLNSETARYVYRLISFKLIFENPTNYGFHIRDSDKYPIIPYYTVDLDTSVTSWYAFAKEHEVTYREVRTFNPWIQAKQLANPQRKTYKVRLPRAGARTFSNIDSLDLLQPDTTPLTDSIKIDKQ